MCDDFLPISVVLVRRSSLRLIAPVVLASGICVFQPFFMKIASHLAVPPTLWLIDDNAVRRRRQRLPFLSADDESECDNHTLLVFVLSCSNCFHFVTQSQFLSALCDDPRPHDLLSAGATLSTAKFRRHGQLSVCTCVFSLVSWFFWPAADVSLAPAEFSWMSVWVKTLF